MTNQNCGCPCGTTPVTNTCGCTTGSSFVLILVLFILLVIIGSIYLY